MKNFLLLLILLFSITLISCGNSETGGGDTSALSPIDTTVYVPETEDNTTIPEQTTVSPETPPHPESATSPETPDVTETTPTEETTTPETTAPVYNFSIGFNNPKEIIGTFKIHATVQSIGDGDPGKIIRSKKQLDNFNWGTNNSYATTPALPVSLNSTIKQFDESFFENNYLLVANYYGLICYTTDEVLYACKDQKKNELYFYYNLKKVQDEPEDKQNYNASWNWWYVFIEIPKELCDESTTAKLSPFHTASIYYYNGNMSNNVSLYKPLKYISFNDPYMSEEMVFMFDLVDLSVYPDSFFEALFQSEVFKKYLLLDRYSTIQTFGTEDRVWVRAIDELLKHCK